MIADTVAMIDRTREADLDIATGRATLLDDPLWDSRILLLDATLQTDLTAQLGRLLNDHPRQTGTSLLVLADSEALPDGGAEVIHLTSNGRLTLSGVGLNLIAAGLTAGEANGIAQHLRPSRPARRRDARPRRDRRRLAGARQPGRPTPTPTTPCPAHHPDGRAAVSVLPEDDDAYVEVAATTPADLAALAPQVPEAVRERVEHADPTLDDDLRTWFDPHCDLPRLMVLGPLTVRVAATGTPTAAAARKPFLTELLAYLATRPTRRHHRGSRRRPAHADRPRPQRRRQPALLARHQPAHRTLPPPRQPPHRRRPPPRPRRLPSRRTSSWTPTCSAGSASAAKPAAPKDSTTSNAPSPSSPGRRSGNSAATAEPGSPTRGRLDQVLQCAIVDVAHLVTTACLADGDLTGAHAAAELAAKVAPAEETAQLDLIAVLAAQGHHQRRRTDAPRPGLQPQRRRRRDPHRTPRPHRSRSSTTTRGSPAATPRRPRRNAEHPLWPGPAWRTFAQGGRVSSPAIQPLMLVAATKTMHPLQQQPIHDVSTPPRGEAQPERLVALWGA